MLGIETAPARPVRRAAWLIAAAIGLAAGCTRAVIGGPDPSADDDVGGPDAAPIVPPMVDAAAPPADAAPVPCTGGDAQVDTGGSCYVLFTTTTATWAGAADVCALMGADAHLASIGDAAEDALIIDLAGDRDVWIAGDDISVEGSWEWNTGEAWSFEHWGSGEPNNGGSSGNVENCAIMRKVGTSTDPTYNVGTWDDRPCERSYAFICERD